jgi:methylthioribulose-1-phosphate dehydratase
MNKEVIARNVQTTILDAKAFYDHGWLLGTSGNLSTRVDAETFIITASGKDKGRLTQQDFLACGLDGKPIDAETRNKPSAETLIHCVIYKRFEHVGAIYHVHEPYAALCSARDKDEEHTAFSGIEMIKGLDIWDPAAIINVPILPNHAHIPTLATAVKEWLDGDRGRWPVPCVNILRHGFYTWGKTPFEAKRNVETLAYLFKYSWEWSLLSRSSD